MFILATRWPVGIILTGIIQDPLWTHFQSCQKNKLLPTCELVLILRQDLWSVKLLLSFFLFLTSERLRKIGIGTVQHDWEVILWISSVHHHAESVRDLDLNLTILTDSMLYNLTLDPHLTVSSMILLCLFSRHNIFSGNPSFTKALA